MTRFKALLWMVIGTLAMIAMIISMNISDMGKEEKSTKKSTDIELAQKTKPKPQAKPAPKPKPKKTQRTPQAPLPNLNTALSGVDMGIPDFALGGIMGSGSELLGDVSKDLTMTESSVDSLPRAQERAPLEYPKEAKRKGIQGYVLFNLLIGKDGHVQRSKILESVPEGVFDDAASASVSQWRFEPATYQGEAVKVWAKQKITFKFQ